MFNSIKPINLLAFFALLLSLTSLGCASGDGIFGVDRCADVPVGAIPEPAGTKVCQWQTAQVAGAVADHTVLYQADFVGTSARLSPGALERMARNANSGLATIQPSFIEPSGDAALDAARVNAVSVQLASYGINEPVVEVATPAALGLRGPQAERVAGGYGNTRNSNVGTGAPVARPLATGGLPTGLVGGFQ